MCSLLEFTRGLLRSFFDLIINIYRDHFKILLVEFKSEDLILRMFAVIIIMGLRTALVIMMYENLPEGIVWQWTLPLLAAAFLIPTLVFYALRGAFVILRSIYLFAYPEKRDKAKNEEKPKHKLEISDDGEADQDIQQWIADNSNSANHL